MVIHRLEISHPDPPKGGGVCAFLLSKSRPLGVYTPNMASSKRAPEIRDCQKMAECCVLGNLRRASRAITQYYDRCLRPAGVRSTQFGLLIAVRICGPMSIKGLAERAGMDRTTLSRNLKPLLEKGFIRLDLGEDRREKEVVLTGRGQQAVSRGIPHWELAHQKISKALGSSRVRRLLADLGAAMEASKG